MKDTTFIAIACGAKTLLLTAEEVKEGVERAAERGLGEPTVAPAAASPEPWVDSRELAKLLNIGDTLVEAMARDNRIPSVRIGKKALRFKPSAVEAKLLRNE